jgi:thiosulfate dehydrogenase
MKSFAWGLLCGILLLFVGAYAFIASGSFPANADSPPPAVERWLAHTSLHASVDREAPSGPNPEAFNDTNLEAGIHLYEGNCLVCHGASDSQASNIAKGLYQHAPQLARRGVEDDPEGETFWKVKHGIRLTGMPAFSVSLSDPQIWQLALFLKHMDALTPAADKLWKSLPSVATK